MSLRPDFKAVFNASPNAYVLLAPDLVIVEANDTYLEVTGQQREDLIGQYIFDVFPGDPDETSDPNVQRVKASFEQVLSTGKRDFLALIPYTIPLETIQGEIVHEERYWSVTHTPIVDEKGKVAYVLQHPSDVTELYKAQKRLQDVQDAHDASEREDPFGTGPEGHRDEEEPSRREMQPGETVESAYPEEGETLLTEHIEGGLISRAAEVQRAYWASEEEREHLRRLFGQAPGFMAFLRGREHIFQLANDAYYQAVGHRDIIGKPIREALPELEGQGFFELLDQVYESGEPYVGREEEVRLERQPGEPLETLYVDFVYQPVTDSEGNVSGIFVQGHDVTEKKRTRDRLRRRQAQLEDLNETLEDRVEKRTQQIRELTSRVTMAEQRERRRIARILHDDLQQRLYGIQLQMSSLRDGQDPGETAEYDEALLQLEKQMGKAIRITRHLSVGMSPPVLQSEGLKATLEWLQSHMQETRGLDVHLSADGEFPMDEEMRVLLFQITRELLVNVALHAGVKEASMELVEEEDDLLVRVIDEGRGFAPEDVEERAPEEGFGLTAARERLRPFGGTLNVHAAPGEGAEVTVRLPMEFDPEAGYYTPTVSDIGSELASDL